MRFPACVSLALVALVANPLAETKIRPHARALVYNVQSGLPNGIQVDLDAVSGFSRTWSDVMRFTSLRVIALVVTSAVYLANTSLSGAAGPQASRGQDQSAPTFTTDVAPIIYAKCASCHRPGEVAPMSLLTYRDVRPWAAAIREKVVSRAMPPWHADPQYGRFRNNLS